MNKSIFVSSTFKDFQVERELILKTIEKEINEALFNKNIKVNFVDLRWGIDTEEGGLKKVITFCIDYVNQSKPYIIIMLGDSYGSLVTKDLLEPIYNINKLKYDGFDKSVTEVEIESSLIFEQDNARKLVLYRTITNVNKEENSIYYDVKNHDKLEKLKEKISASIDKINLYSYTAHLENDRLIIDNEPRFIEFIKTHIIKLIEKDYPSAINNKYEKLSEEYNSYYVENEEIYNIKNNIYNSLSNDKRLYIIQGDKGLGKSSTATKLKELLINDNNEAMIYYFEENKDLLDLELIVKEMLEQINVQTKDVFKTFNTLDPTKKYFFIIDSSDYIVDSNQMEMFINPNVIPSNVMFIMLVTRSNKYEYDYKLKLLNEKAISRVIEKYLKKNQKQVPSKFLDYINKNIDNLSHFKNPSYLMLFLNDICHLSIEEYEYLGKQSDFMSALSLLFINKIENFPKTMKDYLENINEEELLVLQLLSLTSDGLDEEDIRSITWDLSNAYSIGTIKTILFSYDKLINKLNNNKYIISNKNLKEEVLRTLDKDEIINARYQIISSIGARVSKINFSVAKEILYQYYMLKDYKGLATVLSLYNVIFTEEDKHKLGIYFQVLTNEKSTNICEETYLNISKLKIGKANSFLFNYALKDMSDSYVENSLDLFFNLYEDIINQDIKYDGNITYYLISSLVSNSKFKYVENIISKAFKKYLNYGILTEYFRISGYKFSPNFERDFQFLIEGIIDSKEKTGKYQINGFDLYRIIEIIILGEGNAFRFSKDLFNKFFSIIHEYFIDNTDKRTKVMNMLMLGYFMIITNNTIMYPYDDLYEFFSNEDELITKEVASSYKFLIIKSFLNFMANEDSNSKELLNLFKRLIDNKLDLSINDYLITYKIFRYLTVKAKLNNIDIIDIYKYYQINFEKYYEISIENTMLNVKYLNCILYSLYYNYLENNKKNINYNLDKLSSYINLLKQGRREDQVNHFVKMEISYFIEDIKDFEKNKEFENFILNQENLKDIMVYI